MSKDEYDDQGHRIGWIDDNGRHYDAQGHSNGWTDQNGQHYDAQGHSNGWTDQNGRHYDAQGNFIGWTDQNGRHYDAQGHSVGWSTYSSTNTIASSPSQSSGSAPRSSSDEDTLIANWVIKIFFSIVIAVVTAVFVATIKGFRSARRGEWAKAFLYWLVPLAFIFGIWYGIQSLKGTPDLVSVAAPRTHEELIKGIYQRLTKGITDTTALVLIGETNIDGLIVTAGVQQNSNRIEINFTNTSDSIEFNPLTHEQSAIYIDDWRPDLLRVSRYPNQFGTYSIKPGGSYIFSATFSKSISRNASKVTLGFSKLEKRNTKDKSVDYIPAEISLTTNTLSSK